MKFKMRMLHFSPSGNAEKIATALAKDQGANADRIPPAYPVENEKLLFICTELKGSSVDKSVTNLCKDLTPSRAKNVAFLAIGNGSSSALSELKQMLQSKNVNVIDDIHECAVKSGLFSKGNVSDSDIENATVWARKVIDSLVD